MVNLSLWAVYKRKVGLLTLILTTQFFFLQSLKLDNWNWNHYYTNPLVLTGMVLAWFKCMYCILYLNGLEVTSATWISSYICHPSADGAVTTKLRQLLDQLQTVEN